LGSFVLSGQSSLCFFLTFVPLAFAQEQKQEVQKGRRFFFAEDGFFLRKAESVRRALFKKQRLKKAQSYEFFTKCLSVIIFVVV